MKQYICTIEIKNEDIHFFHTNVMYSAENALAVIEQYLEYAKNKYHDLAVNPESVDKKTALETINNEGVLIISNESMDVRITIKITAAELSNSEILSLASAYDNHKLHLTKRHLGFIPDITLEHQLHDTYLSIEIEENNSYLNDFISLLDQENFVHTKIKNKNINNAFPDKNTVFVYVLVNDADAYNKILLLAEPFGENVKLWLSNARKEYKLYCSTTPTNEADEETICENTAEETMEELRSFDTLDCARCAMCEYAKRKIVKSAVLKECVIVNRETGIEDILASKDVFTFISNL